MTCAEETVLCTEETVLCADCGQGLGRATVQYCWAPKNDQARVSPSTAYQCTHSDSTVHRLYT